MNGCSSGPRRVGPATATLLREQVCRRAHPDEALRAWLGILRSLTTSVPRLWSRPVSEPWHFRPIATGPCAP